ncbi:MAG TPA: protein kinase, partial [Longimicrobiaceae bacterium]|nr:protein kinase [Longimicrobiaceae bacterium]
MKWVPDAALDHLRRVGEDGDAFRYAPGEELGRGGMGIVYRAHDRELDREVALKVLSATADAGLAARLRREARILARLEHPGIVPVHDVGLLPDGRLFYAMKLVRG